MTKHRRRTYILPIFGVLLALVTGSTVMVGCPGPARQVELRAELVKIKEEMQPLQSVRGNEYPSSVQAYFDYYGLDFEKQIADAEHLFGTFKSGDETLVGHVYRPVEYEASVVLLHGYLNHTGQMKNLIAHLLKHGYAVGVYDMPGHGLSTGVRASIDDFAEYSRSLSDFCGVLDKLVHGPLHLIGFSAGAAAAIDYLLMQGGNCFEQVILAAPLVRNAAWKSSKAGYKLYSNFADSVPRAVRKNSSDSAFLKFNKEMDVLHAQNVPLRWFKALGEWNDRAAAAEPCDKQVRIIQGNLDTTVSYKYNLKFIKSKFADVEVTMIKGARHELFNERKELRKKVLDRVVEYLEE